MTPGFIGLERRHLIGPAGQGVDRIVVNHPGAVAMVALLDDDVVMIRQYRAPTGDTLLEVPAGKLDAGDHELEVAAARELQEEIGFAPGRLQPLGWFWTAPGYTNERIWVFLATELERAPMAPAGAEEEVAEVVRLPFSEALAMIRRGEIVDAKSIAALSMAAAAR
jgi:ADP-ribose pyrophosphatase